MVNGIGYFQQNLLMKDTRNVYYFIDFLYTDDEGDEATMIAFLSRTFSKTPLDKGDEIYFEDIQKWFDTLTLVSSDISFDEGSRSNALYSKAEAKYPSIGKYAYCIENIPFPSLPSDNTILKDIKEGILKTIGIEKDGYMRDEL